MRNLFLLTFLITSSLQAQFFTDQSIQDALPEHLSIQRKKIPLTFQNKTLINYTITWDTGSDAIGIIELP